MIRRLYSKIRRLGLDTKRLRRTDQKNCPKTDPASKREIDDGGEFKFFGDDDDADESKPKNSGASFFDQSFDFLNEKLRPEGKSQNGGGDDDGGSYSFDDELDLKNDDSLYPDEQFNFIDDEGPRNSTLGLDHPFQTIFEARGPSYWPPAK